MPGQGTAITNEARAADFQHPVCQTVSHSLEVLKKRKPQFNGSFRSDKFLGVLLLIQFNGFKNRQGFQPGFNYFIKAFFINFKSNYLIHFFWVGGLWFISTMCCIPYQKVTPATTTTRLLSINGCLGHKRKIV